MENILAITYSDLGWPGANEKPHEAPGRRADVA